MHNGASCSLDRADMEERLRAWREVSSKALSRESDVNRITTVYPSDPVVVERLKELIAAEASCCSFLDFSLREEGDRTIVELAFPESARSLVEGNLESGLPAPSRPV